MSIPDYALFRNEKYFPQLDGLRCISILAVIFHHAASSFYLGIPVLQLGFFGVHLFFAISGFLITTLLIREKEVTKTISLKKFYTRRFLRIFPLYYTVLALYIILVPLTKPPLERDLFFNYLPYYLTFTSNWFVDSSQNHIPFYLAWSLAVEEQFYLCWPWIEKYAKNSWAVISMIILLLIVQMTILGFFFPWLLPQNFLYVFLVHLSPAIGMGVLLAHLLQNPIGFHWAALAIGRRHSSVLITLLLLGVLATLGASMFLVQLLMVLLVGSCVVRSDHKLYPFLTNSLVKQIGKVSYGMYLTHLLAYHFILKFIANPFDLNHPFFIYPMTCLLTFAAAELSFHYYEGYFLQWKESFNSKTEPLPARF